MTGGAIRTARTKVQLSSKFFFFLCFVIADHLVCSQDRLQTGFITLNHTLPWFHPRASDLEYDNYSHMLKKVLFTSTNHLSSNNSLWSSGREPMLLEGTTPQSWRISSLTGLITTWSPMPQSTPRTNIAADSSMMRVADYSARQS